MPGISLSGFCQLSSRFQLGTLTDIVAHPFEVAATRDSHLTHKTRRVAVLPLDGHQRYTNNQWGAFGKTIVFPQDFKEHLCCHGGWWCSTWLVPLSLSNLFRRAKVAVLFCSYNGVWFGNEVTFWNLNHPPDKRTSYIKPVQTNTGWNKSHKCFLSPRFVKTHCWNQATTQEYSLSARRLIMSLTRPGVPTTTCTPSDRRAMSSRTTVPPIHAWQFASR